MKKLYVFIFLILFALSAGYALVQQDYSKVEIKATKAAGNVYMLEGSGGNIGVSLGEDGVVMIDDQYAPLSDKIKAAIKELGGDAPKFLINTHVHGDHTGGNENFSQESTIIAHTNVRKRLSTKQGYGDQATPAKTKDAWPVITFDHSLSIHFNGEEIKAMHYPQGHTDGDAVIYFTGSNVVHMGDYFFSGMFPYVDLGNGGDVAGYIKNVESVMNELPADVKIIPGHGPISNLDDLKEFHSMMLETTEIVRKQIASGKSLEEIKSAGLPEKWQPWSWRFITTERWLDIVYKSYTRDVTKK